MIYDSILGTIGNTPVVRINKLSPSGATIVRASLNPLSSIKDRSPSRSSGRRAARHAETGTDRRRATSGNTGIALAMVCAAKGYPFVALMSDSFSIERRKLMRILEQRSSSRRPPSRHRNGQR